MNAVVVPSRGPECHSAWTKRGSILQKKTQFISPSLESVSKIMKLDATLN